MRLDHIVYASPDVEADAQRLAASLGVEPTELSTFPPLGIATRHVPIGATPLEVACVTDAETAGRTPWTRSLHRWCEAEPGLVSWALEVDEIEAVSERLDLPVRRSLSGRFSTVGLDQSFETRYLPFFIAWSSAKPRPLNDLTVHAIDLEGDPGRWHDWLGDGADLAVNILEGSGRLQAVRVLGVRRDGSETSIR